MTWIGNRVPDIALRSVATDQVETTDLLEEFDDPSIPAPHFDESRTRWEVILPPCGEVIDDPDLVTPGQVGIGNMTTDEACSTCDQDPPCTHPSSSFLVSTTSGPLSSSKR